MDNKFDLDSSWDIVKIFKVSEFEDLLQYSFLFDDSNEENCGLMEFDKETIEDIVKSNKSSVVFKYIVSGRITMLKQSNNPKHMLYDEFDYGVIIALKIIATYYKKFGTYPNELEMVNPLYLEKLKESDPEGYNEFMSEFNKLKNENVT